MAESPAQIGVTGSTGRLGGRVARRLATAGVRQRLLVRDPARAPQLPRTSVVRAPFAEPDAVRAALTGVPTVLMVSASETRRPGRAAHRVRRRRRRGRRRHLVYISFSGAAPDCTFTLGRDHYATEQHIRASGVAFTFLRDNFYADFMPAIVGEDGVLRGPAGDGRVAVVAQDDIADAAVAVLLDPAAHAGATYTLTGPEALSLGRRRRDPDGRTRPAGDLRAETVDEAYSSRRVLRGAAVAAGRLGVHLHRDRATARSPRSATTSPRSRAIRATSLSELIRRDGAAY